jgi:hypothetical protein
MHQEHSRFFLADEPFQMKREKVIKKKTIAKKAMQCKKQKKKDSKKFNQYLILK